MKIPITVSTVSSADIIRLLALSDLQSRHQIFYIQNNLAAVESFDWLLAEYKERLLKDIQCCQWGVN